MITDFYSAVENDDPTLLESMTLSYIDSNKDRILALAFEQSADKCINYIVDLCGNADIDILLFSDDIESFEKYEDFIFFEFYTEQGIIHHSLSKNASKITLNLIYNNSLDLEYHEIIGLDEEFRISKETKTNADLICKLNNDELTNGFHLKLNQLYLDTKRDLRALKENIRTNHRLGITDIPDIIKQKKDLYTTVIKILYAELKKLKKLNQETLEAEAA